MRRIALYRSSVIHAALAALAALAVFGLISGCGGGSSAPSNGAGGGQHVVPGTATVTGQVVDNLTSQPVTGAVISVVGTSIRAVTASNGNFSLIGVPLTATQMLFASPSTQTYQNYVYYQGTLYNETVTDGGPCPMPLPALEKGVNALPATIQPEDGGNQPPPPPTTGCP